MPTKKDAEGVEEEISEEKKEPKLTDLPGIGPAVSSKLESAGVYDLMGLAVMNPSELSDIAGVGAGVARKAIQAARNMLDLGFQTGTEYAKKREDIFCITTGSNNLNNLLGGKGVTSRSITEAFGAYGSGKCVSKDTFINYFNDSLHVETIQETYEKYNHNNEFSFEEGFAVPLNTVKVMTIIDNKLKITNATHLYREKVKKLFLIKTKRGRALKITGNHQLFNFDNGFCWKKTCELNKGDIIIYPKELNLENESSILTEDDAYFIGFFVAEGTRNPFSVCNSNKNLIGWITNYIQKKFSYNPSIKIDNRRDNPVYTILLRNSTKKMMEGLESTNSSSKFIPEIIFNSNKKIISSFLAGYLEGDAEIAKDIVAATTKSKRLASQLSFLFLRLGISATLKIRKINGEEFVVVFVVGEDREKINNLPFKSKKAEFCGINSAYGFPKQIIYFLRKGYQETIGGNRGRQEKIIGKKNFNNMAYQHLTHKELVSNMNTKTFEEFRDLFLKGKEILEDIFFELSNKDLSTENLNKIFAELPFAFNSVADKMGVRKSTMRNYNLRKIPENKKEILKKVLLEEVEDRIKKINSLLEIINKLKGFNYDLIENITEIDYDDYVYDFVVPEGHSFIGGNMPTMMHNTQLGLTLAVNVQLPLEQGGVNGKCVFIDTEGTFRPKRIKEIAEAIGANSEKVLKNIFVARAFNSDHQILLIEKISEMVKNGEPIKLLIVDSLTAHFRAEFAGRGQLADRQQKLNKYMHNLMKLAEQHNLAVYVTNQVMSNPAQMFGDPTVAIGGNIVGHACLTRDSLIQLADGSIKEINSMKQEEVMSGNFKNFNIEKAKSEFVFVNPNINKLYEIITNNQVKCSALHRFFTIENFSVVEKEAKDLKKGDFVMQAGKINIEGEEQKLPQIGLRKIGKLNKEDSKKIVEELKKENVSRCEVCKKIGITPRQFRKVLNQSYPTNFETLNQLQDYFSGRLQLQLVPVCTYKHRDLMMPEIMTPQLAQICGYFIGNGNFENRSLRFRDERAEVLEVYNLLFKEAFGINSFISKMKNKNCYTLNINSKEIRDLFILIINDIFNYVGKSKKDVIGAFIKGFADAEGHIDKKRAMITIAQKEKQILRYLQLFMLRLGIRSTIKFEIGKKKMNVLRIANRDILKYVEIGFTARDKQKELISRVNQVEKTYLKEMMPIKRKEIWNLLKSVGLHPSRIIKLRQESYRWINRKELENAFNALMNIEIKDRQIKQKIDFIFKLLNSEIRFEKIREIKIEDNADKQAFFDFSVPKNENYIANGFIVHNSTYRMYFRRGKKDSRVAKLIDSPDLPDNETVFFLTNAGIKDGVVEED